MNWTKLLGVAILVVGEVKEDLKDNKVTVNEVIDSARAIVNKLGYGDKPILKLSKKE